MLIEYIDQEKKPIPPVHLLTGISTSLRSLAEIVVRKTDSSSKIIEARPRSFDVSHFYGDPKRAQSILGWKALVPLDDGLSRLIEQTRIVTANNSRVNPKEKRMFNHGYHLTEIAKTSRNTKDRWEPADKYIKDKI